MKFFLVFAILAASVSITTDFFYSAIERKIVDEDFGPSPVDG